MATWPLHPFLFAAASIFSVYAANLRETTFADVATALGAVLALTCTVFVAYGVAVRRLGARAAVLTTVTIMALLHYADLSLWMNRFVGGAVYPEDVALPWAVAALAIALVAIWFMRSGMGLPNTILNGIALVFLVSPLTQVGWHAWTSRQELSVPGASQSLANNAEAMTVRSSSSNLPDIYYIILDRYASQETLLADYGFNNQEMIGYLEAAGFFVASASHSNYLKTATSLASSLSLDYINFLSEKADQYGTAWHPIYDMLGDHRVGRFLKRMGYTNAQIGSWWRPTQYNAFADESHSFGFSEFDYVYLRKTMLPQLIEAVLPGSNLAQRMSWDSGQCQRVPHQLEQIKAIGGRPTPTFVFAHILLPHEPYVFDAQGRCLSRTEVDARGMKAGYVGQLQYANLLLRDLVSDLLDRPGKRPIIILQADEGPFPERYATELLSWREATSAELQMKTGILNAYFFPDGNYEALYAEITPVNSFRIVFNQYFGSRFALLPDRIYASPDVFHIYEFFDVTDRVSSAGPIRHAQPAHTLTSSTP